jgi:hypothetical protein
VAVQGAIAQTGIHLAAAIQPKPDNGGQLLQLIADIAEEVLDNSGEFKPLGG